ncbi:hypothetical protein SAMN05216559_1032 [Halomicrobium zhouii]|uniref:Uncharacterized protein n=1 Tax=Halomicrobium zhouii TaxID=767519 RepID=A0A1I6KM08_9EURY|nr:hypothetical protein SAMN05216559_1032 [Halomicrobium zhouii]
MPELAFDLAESTNVCPCQRDTCQSHAPRNPVGGHLPIESDSGARQRRYRTGASGSGRQYGQRNAAARLAGGSILPLSVVN